MAAVIQNRPNRKRKQLENNTCTSSLTSNDGFQVENYGEKGRGVKTLIKRQKGVPLLPYEGETISREEGDRRERKESTGFRFFFQRNGQSLCIDASKEDGTFGRLVNHGSGKYANAEMKLHMGTLWIFSLRDIQVGEEILYDYGIRRITSDKVSKLEKETRNKNNANSLNQRSKDENLSDEEDANSQNGSDFENISDKEVVNSNCSSEDEYLPDEDDANTSDQISSEDETLSDEGHEGENNSSGQNSAAHSVKDGKQVFVSKRWDRGKKVAKSNCCLYCGKMYQKLSRHLGSVHFAEEKVREALKHPKHSIERKKALLAIHKKGNHNHNYTVLSKGTGLLIPTYRPRTKEARNSKDYIPCECCFGLYLKRDLWRHSKRCKQSKNFKPERGLPISNGQLLLPPTTGGGSKELKSDILSRMKSDVIREKIENDTTLVAFGERLYEKDGHLIHRHNYISQKLRELGRFLIAISDIDTKVDSIEKSLYPENWEKVLQATKSVAGYDKKTASYDIPALPLKIGQSLCKCAKILKANSIVAYKPEVKQKMDGFLELFEMEWAMRIAAMAHNSLHRARSDRPELLPLTEDVQTFHNFLSKKTTEVKGSNDLTVEQKHREMIEITLTQIMLFNGKRGGEVQRIKTQDLKNLSISEITDDVILLSLTKFEKTLAKSLRRIEVIGNSGNEVPILLTDEMVDNLKLVEEMRSVVNVTTDFIFGIPNSRHPVRGSDCLRRVAKESGVNEPHVVTSVKLRKQLTTMWQALALNDHGQDILAAFVGHDIREHHQYYQLPENTAQLAKVWKVLHAINNGKSNYLGKDLEEVSLDQEDVEEDDKESDDDDDNNDDDGDYDNDNDNNDYDVDDEEENDGKTSKCIVKNKRKYMEQGNRKTWTPMEQKAVLKHLSKYVTRGGALPGKKECLDVKRKEADVLKNRSWQHIKFFVRNRITSHRRSKKLLPYS